MRWLLCLSALCALSAVGRSAPCRCVDPVTCPEAVVVSRPMGCRLRSRRPGVCCPTHKTSGRTPTFNIKVGRGAKRAVFSVTVVSGGRSGERRLLRRSRLPPGARSFLQRFALNSGDNMAARTVVSARRRVRMFRVVILPPKRRFRSASRISPSKFLRFLQSSGVIIQAKQSPIRPSRTTKMMYLNSRSSPVSQHQALQALLILQQSQMRKKHLLKQQATDRKGLPAKMTCSCSPQGLRLLSVRRVRDGDDMQPKLSQKLSRLRQLLIVRRSAAPFLAAVRVSPAGQVPGCTPAPAVRCASAANYRTITGQCNNLHRPRWGSGFSGLRRIFDNTFEDGVFAPRSRSAAGGALPSARAVSARAFHSSGSTHRLYTMSVVTFGQFMDHDLSLSPHFQIRKPDGRLMAIECCEKGGQMMPKARRHPQCLPIAIDASDPYYGRHKRRCMNFVRSIPAPEPQCRPRPAAQINELTSWIDLSQVYGNTEEKNHKLRTFRGGLLRTSKSNMMPREVPQPATNCTSRVCFIAGDERVNENSLLTLFHTVFMREHNRVARALAARHRSWSDEKLFQEARRLVIAEWQHIAYHEWLPAIVGFRFARQVGLTGYGRRAYVPFLNPTVSTEFSTAGFRLHSMVQGVIEMVSKVGTIRQRLQLRDNFFRPDSLVVSKLFSEMARGLTRQHPKRFGRSFEKAVRGDLFRVGAVGLDLMALNIQRGRDHGIPTYATVAARCHGVQIADWSGLRQLMPVADARRLRDSYRHWRDIDLFVGISMERPAAGALVGPTARCLITDQFLRTRYADRFFYDQAGQSGSFSSVQLREIRKASWARLLCDNVGRGFDAVQPLAFIKPISFGGLNPVVSCNSYRIGRVNLNRF